MPHVMSELELAYALNERAKLRKEAELKKAYWLGFDDGIDHSKPYKNPYPTGKLLDPLPQLAQAYADGFRAGRS